MFQQTRKETTFVVIGALRAKVIYIPVTQGKVSASGPKVLMVFILLLSWI